MYLIEPASSSVPRLNKYETSSTFHEKLSNNVLGKTGTKLTCKCKGEKCKWKNDMKKIVNGKKTKTYRCE